MGNSFGAFFSMPNGTDPGNIYFRDPVAAGPSLSSKTAAGTTAQELPPLNSVQGSASLLACLLKPMLTVMPANLGAARLWRAL